MSYNSNKKVIEINYSYQHVPTIWKFANDNSRHRLIMGPVGCVDGDTEFLTPKGWKKISDYEEGDLVAQVIIKESHLELEYVKPNAYIRAYLPTGFYHFKTPYVDNMLSPDHTMYVLRDFYGFPQFGNVSAAEAVYLSSIEDIGLMHIHDFTEDKIKIMPKDIVPYKVSHEDITFIQSPEKEPFIQYCFTLPTKKFLARRNENVFITGNSGKSSGCVWEIIRRGLSQRPSPIDGKRRTRWAVIRNTYRQLNDTTMKTFFDWFPPSQFGEWRVAEHVYKLTAFDKTEIEILFRALDSPESVSNLLSLDLTGAWINEAKEISKEVFDMLDTRINRYPPKKHGGPSWTGIIMDTNPPDEDSWLYRLFEVEKPKTCAIFKQPSGLSPDAENLPNLPSMDYYHNLMVGKSPDFIKVFVHGQYGVVKSGRAVYSGYNDELHVSKYELKPLIKEPIILGLDFGLNVSAVICQVTPRGRFFVLDELYSDLGARSFIENKLVPLINMKYRGFTIVGFGDPAGVQRSQTDERTCYDELRMAGFKLTPASTNALAARIGAVEALLNRLVDGEPCFQLNPHCTILRRGFNGGYKFRELQGFSGRYSDLPEKNKYSHLHDALQYAALYVEERIRPQQTRPLLIIPKHKPVTITRAGY
jgi:hypothetical protein